jgi:hypothetical protein
MTKSEKKAKTSFFLFHMVPYGDRAAPTESQINRQVRFSVLTAGAGMYICTWAVVIDYVQAV